MGTDARPSSPPRRSSFYDSDRTGCIVTWVDNAGDEHVEHEPGLVSEALRRITSTIPTGGYVQSISTWRSILHDLRGMPRVFGGIGRHPRVDPYAVERSLLGKIDRLDLLPVQARKV